MERIDSERLEMFASWELQVCSPALPSQIRIKYTDRPGKRCRKNGSPLFPLAHFRRKLEIAYFSVPSTLNAQAIVTGLISVYSSKGMLRRRAILIE